MADLEAQDTEAVEARAQDLSARVFEMERAPALDRGWVDWGRLRTLTIEAGDGEESQLFAVVPQTMWQVMGLSEDCGIPRHSESKFVVCEPRRWVGFV